MNRDSDVVTRPLCVPGLIPLLVETELIVHILLSICDWVNGGESCSD